MTLVKLWDALTRKKNPPWCVDCRFSQPSPYNPSNLFCRHPIIDPVGGWCSDVTCKDARIHYCKLRGRYFEPRASEPERNPEEDER